MTYHFAYCPRCNDDRFRCYGCGACGISFYPNGQIFLYFNAIHIMWDLDTHQCMLLQLRPPFSKIEIEWLPYTVSKEDIEKYLVLL
jgi:hypothetical protein